ncbi:hypothetical protein HK101_004066 [Irineochytrium annulatum]|nr:hypothetical protein HK101_004066 [Irineochytrium annulatum]
MLLTTLALIALASASRAAFYEPADGRAILGFWLDTSAPNATIGSGGDTPALLNSRLGIKAGAFQLSQNIPVLEIKGSGGKQNVADVTFLEATATDAYMFMTVSPDNGSGTGFEDVTDEAVQTLAQQVFNLSDASHSNRRLLLRLAPEMNGNFLPSFQGRPLAFVAFWKRVWTAVRKLNAKVDFVWSPNEGAGYPYGTPISAPGGLHPNTTEYTELDTDKSGTVDMNDDPYSPYYPGDQYVDWVGLSMYWKGTTTSADNEVVPPNEPIVADYMTSQGVGFGIKSGQTNTVDFYDVYCNKAGKPFAISETNAYYNVETTNQANHSQIAKSYYSQFLTNATFFATYPKVKLVNLFEFKKYDDNYLRDFRVTSNDVLPTFKQDLSTFLSSSNIYILGNSTGAALSSTPVATSAAAAPTVSSAPVAVTTVTAASTTKSSGERMALNSILFCMATAVALASAMV